MRTENVITEWQSTQEQLLELEEATEREDCPLLQQGSELADPDAGIPQTTALTLIKSQHGNSAVIKAANTAMAGTGPDERAIATQNTSE